MGGVGGGGGLHCSLLGGREGRGTLREIQCNCLCKSPHYGRNRVVVWELSDISTKIRAQHTRRLSLSRTGDESHTYALRQTHTGPVRTWSFQAFFRDSIGKNCMKWPRGNGPNPYLHPLT